MGCYKMRKDGDMVKELIINTKEKYQPIDVVIAWVDGNDPKHMAKRQKWLKQTGDTPIAGAHSTRFASVNEIKYCLLSILKFAPFVQNIFIVTDDQDPQLMDDVQQFFPERANSIRIVDHKEIFEGYEQYLPTFNSINIANMLWRIKGISNRFVYFNDDIFLVREVKPEDFFVGNTPLIRGKWTLAPYYRTIWSKVQTHIIRFFTSNRNFTPRASFHMGQWNSAKLVGYKSKYFTTSHTAHSAETGLIESFFNQNMSVLEKNISFRFRDQSQFTFISLSNHLQLRNGNRNIAKPDLVYMQPYNRKANYIDKKLKQCDKDPSIKFLCVQSLDMCTKDEQDKVLNWLKMNLQR